MKLVCNTNALELVTLAFEVEGSDEFGETVVRDLDDRIGKGNRRIRLGGKGKSGGGGGGVNGGRRDEVVTGVASAHYEWSNG